MKKLIFMLLAYAQVSAFAQTSDFASALENIRINYQLPGLSAAILQDGEIKEIGAVGVRKEGEAAKITHQDKFHLGSCNKSMTATLLALFIEEGKLSWNSTLEELFPERNLHQDYRKVTLEMLLSHRSGMYRGAPFYDDVADEYRQSTSATQDRAITTAIMLSKAPEFGPDTTDSYSNTGYLIAGHILERLSGKSWENLIQEKIFQPLGMNSCGQGATSILDEASPSQLWGHYLYHGVLTPYHKDSPEMWGPAGRVHCSLADWGKYLQIHLDGYNGRDHLLKASSFQDLHRIFPSSEMSYTPGAWFRLERNWGAGTVFTHNGTNLVNYARVWLAPERNVALMAVTNRGGDETFNGTNETLNLTGQAVNEAISLLIDRHLR